MHALDVRPNRVQQPEIVGRLLELYRSFEDVNGASLSAETEQYRRATAFITASACSALAQLEIFLQRHGGILHVDYTPDTAQALVCCSSGSRFQVPALLVAENRGTFGGTLFVPTNSHTLSALVATHTELDFASNLERAFLTPEIADMWHCKVVRRSGELPGLLCDSAWLTTAALACALAPGSVAYECRVGPNRAWCILNVNCALREHASGSAAMRLGLVHDLIWRNPTDIAVHIPNPLTSLSVLSRQLELEVLRISDKSLLLYDVDAVHANQQACALLVESGCRHSTGEVGLRSNFSHHLPQGDALIERARRTQRNQAKFSGLDVCV